MHWHAIKRSARSLEGTKSPSPQKDTQYQEVPNLDGERLQAMTTESPLLQGQDHTLDTLPQSQQLASNPAMGLTGPSLKTDEVQSGDDDDDDTHLPVPIPSSTTSTIIPFAYERALRNRIRNPKLQRHGEYDTRAFTPTFVHDCLIIPGSLANVLGKVSPEDILHRITPALLPGFHAHVHADTQQPCLIQSPNPADYVQGMLIFGQGRKGRDRIHAHYRPNARRVKVLVEFDVQIAGRLADGDYSHERWRLQRRTIWAHAWLWSNVGSIDACFCPRTAGWSLEDYLEGLLGLQRSLRVEVDGKGDEREDEEVSVDGNNNEPEEREIVYGSCGTLNYERAGFFTGW